MLLTKKKTLMECCIHPLPPYMQDLATAFIKVLGNEKASKEVFNISGEKYVTFDGLAKACAKVNILLSLSFYFSKKNWRQKENTDC